MKKTLTRAEKKKIQKANAQWARETKMLAQMRAGSETVERVKEGKAMKGKGQKEKTTKEGKQRMMALREIQRYQRSTDLLIQ